MQPSHRPLPSAHWRWTYGRTAALRRVQSGVGSVLPTSRNLQCDGGSGTVYLGTLDLGWLDYWRRGAGVTVLSIALPPLLPYIISAVHSWRTATYNRLRTTAFLLILIMGAIGVFCAILGTNGMSLDRSALLWVFAIQAAVYFFSAEFLFDVD